MPIEKLGLILVFVICAAAATIWLASLVPLSIRTNGSGWLVFVPMVLIGYLAWRWIGERIGRAWDDHIE